MSYIFKVYKPLNIIQIIKLKKVLIDKASFYCDSAKYCNNENDNCIYRNNIQFEKANSLQNERRFVLFEHSITNLKDKFVACENAH